MIKKSKIIDLIRIEEYSIIPKYLQIANAVIREIDKGNIQAGDRMPSINELSIELDIANDTVERGYKYLKSIGIIGSVLRKGYYINVVEQSRPLKVFLIFDKLNAQNKSIYESFIASLDQRIVDISFKEVDSALEHPNKEGEVYINVMEEDILALIKTVVSLDHKSGEGRENLSYKRILLENKILKNNDIISQTENKLHKEKVEKYNGMMAPRLDRAIPVTN